MDALTSEIATAAQVLPEALIETLAKSLETLDSPSSMARAVLQAAAQIGLARTHANEIWMAWSHEPSLPGSALALALRSSTLVATTERTAEKLEIAWTGPSTPSVPVRQTSPILLDLIAGCQKELLVVSFAAYKIPSVLDALMTAGLRGVDVRLVLESSADSSGSLSFDARNAFAVLEGRAHFYSWPIEQRGIPGGLRRTLHAKAVVADEQRALVTSANLTGNALEVNMELGLLVEGGPIPRRLAAHFAELIARGILRQVV